MHLLERFVVFHSAAPPYSRPKSRRPRESRLLYRRRSRTAQQRVRIAAVEGVRGIDGVGGEGDRQLCRLAVMHKINLYFIVHGVLGYLRLSKSSSTRQFCVDSTDVFAQKLSHNHNLDADENHHPFSRWNDTWPSILEDHATVPLSLVSSLSLSLSLSLCSIRFAKASTGVYPSCGMAGCL